MGLDKYIISMLVFSALIFGGILLIGDFNDSYDDVSISTSKFSDINGSVNDIDILYNMSTGMKEDVYGGKITEDNTENTMFKGAFSAIRLVSQSFGIMGKITISAADELGVPAYFISIVMTAMLVFVIFSVIFLVLRFRG